MSAVPFESLVGVAICLAASAFFSGSETALTSITSAKAAHLLEQGGRGAKVLNLWINQPLRVLTTILIGNNIFNITASALATQIAEQALAEHADALPVDPIAIAVGVMTLLLLTFGEITPKALAKANAERVAVPVLYVLRPLNFVLTPFTTVFMKLSKRMAEATGSSLSGNNEVTVTYLEKLVEIGEREGTISEDDADMLQSVLDFSETIAREVMVPRTDLIAVPIDIDFDDLVDVFSNVGHSRVPVYRESIDQIAGLFYAKDMLSLQHEQSQTGKAADLTDALRPVTFVPETKPVADLLREMQENRTHMVILADEHGGVAGIVTIEDIIEEIFGEIRDEYDHEAEDIVRVNETTLLVSGGADIDDLETELDLPLNADGESDTVGGYLLTHLGRFPEEGETLTIDRLRFVIIEASDRRIVRVRVKVLPDPFEESEES